MDDEFYANGRDAYRDGETESDNPYAPGSHAHNAWDRGYWDEHNDAISNESAGFEAAYGDWWADAEMSRWDDDPSVYDGTYSEM